MLSVGCLKENNDSDFRVSLTPETSKKLIKKAIEDKVNYIALGAFYSSKTKKVKFKANIKLLKAAKKMTKIHHFFIKMENFFNRNCFCCIRNIPKI